MSLFERLRPQRSRSVRPNQQRATNGFVASFIPLEERVLPATFHVAPTGIDTNAGSEAAPFRNIQRAVNAAVSGDTIKVAAGTYTYSAANDQTSPAFGTTGVVSVVGSKSLTVAGGYTTANWQTANPTTNVTIIDGQDQFRGVYVSDIVDWSSNSTIGDTGVTLDGLTIRNGRAASIPSRANNLGAGGGVLVEFANLAMLRVTLEDNHAIGGNNTGAVGGAGAGGGLAIFRSTGPGSNLAPLEAVALNDVEFRDNTATGGLGAVRGGFGQGGGLFSDFGGSNLAIDILAQDLLFENNTVVGGDTLGSGDTGDFIHSDGIGGGMHIVFTIGIFTDTTVIDNHSRGGNAPNGTPGGGHGGGVTVEKSTGNFINSTFADNTTTGGDRDNTSGTSQSAEALGGGINVDSGNLTLDRTSVLRNRAIGGSAPQIKGVAGGGGISFASFLTPQTNFLMLNSVVADNVIEQGAAATEPIFGGGAGVWLNGAIATIDHSTIANNSAVNANFVTGQALVALNAGTSFVTTATISNSIIANHANTTNSAAVHVLPGNTVNFNGGLFAQNTVNTNAAPFPFPVGTINGLSTMLSAGSAGFVSPGTPNFDYHLAAGSAAINQAIGSGATVDRDNAPRSGVPDYGAYESTASAAAPVGTITPIAPDPRTAPVGNVSISFDLDVTGVDLADFTLTRNGTNLSLAGAVLTAQNARQYTLNLGAVAQPAGDYVLTLVANASGIQSAGVPLVQNASDTWTKFDAGVTVSPSSITVAEGGPSTAYSVVLTAPPTADVTITITAGAQLTRNPGTLTFTTANWNIAQNVVITAVDDAAVEGAHSDQITHTATSADTGYNAILISVVTADIGDNDIADSFNRADGNTLGAGWTAPAGSYAIQGNRAVATTGTTAQLATLNASQGVETDGVIVEADIDLTTTVGHAGVVARASVDGMNMYLGAIVHDGAFSTAQIWKRVNGTWTNLAFQLLSTEVRMGRLRLEISETTLLLKVNGNIVTLAFDDDLPPSANGLAGIRASGGISYDNFAVLPNSLMKVALPYDATFTGADGSLPAEWNQRFDRFDMVGGQARAVNVLFGRSVATLNTSQRVADAIVEADISLNPALATTHSGVIARYSGPLDTNMYLGAIVKLSGRFEAHIWVNKDGEWKNLAANVFANHNNGVGRIQFQVHGSTQRLSFNGVVVATTSNTEITAPGYVGLRAVSGEVMDNFHARLSAAPPMVGALSIVSGNFTATTATRFTATLDSSVAVNRSATTLNGTVSANVTLASGVSAAGLIARYSGPGDDNWYWGALVSDGAGGFFLQIFKKVNGVVSQVGASLAAPAGSGLLTFTLNGNQLALSLGAVQLSVVDNSITTAGNSGIRGFTGTIFDNVAT